MCPLPELNLNLGIVTRQHTSSPKDEGEIIVKTDSQLKTYTITIIISDQEAGKIQLKIGNQEVEIPTYKLTVTDDKTNETEVFQVTRDTLNFMQTKTKMSFLSFLGFKKFDKTSFLYENIPFEPQSENLEKFELSKYRSLSENSLSYTLNGNGKNIIIYAGNINDFQKQENISQYFIVVNHNDGQSFIVNMMYREKMLKLTPKIELHIVKRKNIPKNFEIDEEGKIRKLIYL
ncbi:hypothetical protein SAMN05421664_0858 [Chryseobacterium soldanellicola]|uniref:Uncharacterized protein n=1 Tax=Chryseobacterium soldanellicola TaxID=311333 RepID=A0A1H0YPE6_9FLAO|nr:hypothetical protein [Chryseobacterium soldanellicola]SDQ17000.1 hypothetical protein SAMN05421664_0858 [Chryseobacterium soldanellicola]